MEGDPLAVLVLLVHKVFQSTPSHGGRHKPVTYLCSVIWVSIHALTWRATYPVQTQMHARLFQSTPSHGGRHNFSSTVISSTKCFNPRPHMEGDVTGAPLRAIGCVSIHALTWRATTHRITVQGLLVVSIHALTWRATLVNKTYSLTSYYNIQNANIHKILLNKKYGTLFLVPTI